MASPIDRKLWKQLWHSSLHERHKVLIWKLLVNILPTKDRISFAVPLPDTLCFLCNDAYESTQHLLLDCPIAKLCWWSSPWHFRMHVFSGLTPVDWISLLLRVTASPLIPTDLLIEDHLIHFAAVVFERMWAERNRIRLGHDKPDWNTWILSVNRQFHRYWSAAQVKAACESPPIAPLCWQPPLMHEVKFNFDAAVRGTSIASGVVLRNHLGHVCGVWTSTGIAANVFCAELQALLFAFDIATQLQITKAIFEGDAKGVILAIKGHSCAEDWRASDALRRGRQVLQAQPLWFVEFVHRRCNSFAHKMAGWAIKSGFSGRVNPENLPPGLFCDGDDSNSVSSVVDDND